MTYDDDDVAGDDATGGDAVAGGGPNYAQGRLAMAFEHTDADAAEVVHAYAYDSAGRLSRIWDAQGNTLASYTYTAAGNIDAHVVGDGISTGRYAYNARDWVTGLDYAGAFRSTLTYDPAGNITRQVYRHGSAAAKPEEYAYDDLYRITGFELDGGDSRDYAYDRNSNITSLVTGTSTPTYNYSDASTPNRLDSTTGTGGQTYAYNQNGWMTARGTDTVDYDYRGLTTGYGSASYLMDPDRRRVKKTVGAAVTYYLRGADGAVLAEYSDQNLLARYVYAGSRRIVRIAGDSASYYLADHLGSTRALVDDEGAVTATYDYWPYGETLVSGGSEETHFRFTGHERDDEAGLDYMLERSYAFDIGRFQRPDPMQDEYPGISPYAYANNNPLKYVDPDGRLLWKVVTKGLKVAGRAYDTAKRGKSLFKKDTWKDIGTDEFFNFVDNVSTIADGVWDANDVFAIIDLATDQGELAKRVTKGLGNPFKGKTPGQIDKMFRKKGFDPKGSNPAKGKGSFINPNSGRKYYIDERDRRIRKGRIERPHVDAHRDKSKTSLPKKKYPLGDRLYE